MKDLEEKTYQYTVKGIGLIKSFEKHFPELAKAELKENIGKVSTKFMDAFDSKENEDFAGNLRESLKSAQNSHELLNAIGTIENTDLEQEKKQLIDETTAIINQLEKIVEKLIY